MSHTDSSANHGGQPLLEVRGLDARYGSICALAGVDLTIPSGALVALVGANGAGKTTLLRALSGLQPVSAGHVLFEGDDITHADAARRVTRGIVQVPEGRQVFAPMSVEDNLRLGAYTRKRDATISSDIDAIYAQFPILADKRRQAAGMLSGGQQQMLAIGRALMAKPRLLLLDEPSMGLAPLLIADIFKTVEALNADGITILLVEQNASAALAIADHAFVLENGEIALQGTGAALLNDDNVKRAYLGI